jgi:nucleoside-triphosphatase
MGTTVLLTSAPGVGKTTLIQRLLTRLPGPAGGFYTEEIRERGKRVGFRLVTLAGESVTLAHVDIPKRFRVGRYGVDVAALDRVGVVGIRQAVAARHIVVVDEIGKMELFSQVFRAAVLEAMESASPMLGTIMFRPHPWADALKARPGVHAITVTRENRDALVEDVLARLTDKGASRR